MTILGLIAIGTISLRARGYVSSHSIGVGLNFLDTKVSEAHLTDHEYATKQKHYLN
jgi:hypothetical protein